MQNISRYNQKGMKQQIKRQSSALSVILRDLTKVERKGKLNFKASQPPLSEKAMAPHSSTEQLHFHFLLSCIGEGNGNPLQCSCLENSRDGGAWWAAVYGVAHSRTQLKRLSSSSSSPLHDGKQLACLPGVWYDTAS